MTALRAGTGLHPLPNLLLQDVTPVSRLTRLRIDVRKHVLKDGFLMTQELARLPVELPQDTGLTDRQCQLMSARVHQDPLEHFVEVERFAGDVLEVPDQFPSVRVERHRGAGVKPSVPRLRA